MKQNLDKNQTIVPHNNNIQKRALRLIDAIRTCAEMEVQMGKVIAVAVLAAAAMCVGCLLKKKSTIYK